MKDRMTTAEYNAAVRDGWSEAVFQGHVVTLAKTLGWQVFHPWLSINSTGGYPDLTMVRGCRLVFAELKGQRRYKVPDAQVEWHAMLRGAGQEAYIWWPSNWDDIEEVLR